MGVATSLVSKRVRRGRTRWVIDFFYVNTNGERVRFRQDAELQTRDGAAKEAREVHERAILTGSPEKERVAPVVTLEHFYKKTFKPEALPLFRKNTRTRYEALWRQVAAARA
jgi:hypothetical protein